MCLFSIDDDFSSSTIIVTVPANQNQGVQTFQLCRSEQRVILPEQIFKSLYLALDYLKPLPELSLALPLQRKKLSDVMVAKN